MDISLIEKAQKMSDFRSRMLDNKAAGRPAWHGFTRDELKQGMEYARAGRGRAQEAGAKTRQKKAAEAKGTPPDMSFLNEFLGVDG